MLNLYTQYKGSYNASYALIFKQNNDERNQIAARRLKNCLLCAYSTTTNIDVKYQYKNIHSFYYPIPISTVVCFFFNQHKTSVWIQTKTSNWQGDLHKTNQHVLFMNGTIQRVSSPGVNPIGEIWKLFLNGDHCSGEESSQPRKHTQS